jgi:hypothetical protein
MEWTEIPYPVFDHTILKTVRRMGNFSGHLQDFFPFDRSHVMTWSFLRHNEEEKRLPYLNFFSMFQYKYMLVISNKEIKFLALALSPFLILVNEIHDRNRSAFTGQRHGKHGPDHIRVRVTR